MADLIVVESPSKVADIEKYARKAGFDVRGTATAGHLLDLPPMRDGPGVDIEAFAPERLVPRDAAAGTRIGKLKVLIAKADRVIVATDPDREGEAIAAQVWHWIPKRKALRARFEEITAAGIAKGLSEMTTTLEQPVVDASVARRLVDRLAGWHATALVFAKLPTHPGVSAGRLQSAALRLVVERFREHEAFKAKVTFTVRLKVRAHGGAEFWARPVIEGRPASFESRNAAEAFQAPVSLRVLQVEHVEKAERPRPPFEATTWLQVAQKALGLSVKDATAATQSLFEAGSTTYPRTDSVRVSVEAVEWARQELRRRFGDSYVPTAPWEHKDKAGVQAAHEAIRPTLTTEQESLAKRAAGQWGPAYSLIEARFLASQAAARRVQVTKVTMSDNTTVFAARGDVEIFDGWQRVVGTEAREEVEDRKPGEAEELEGPWETSALPPLKTGDSLDVLETEVVTVSTRPKPLFTQAALVAELRRRGIGRPSTYQSVVPLLLTRGWAIEKSWAGAAAGTKAPDATTRRRRLPVLIPTPVGSDLTDFLVLAVPGLVDYEFTAALERQLDDVENGSRSRKEVGQGWWKPFAAEIGKAGGLATERPVRPDLGECPRCRGEGRAGRLRLIAGVSKGSGKPYEFAGCDADTRAARACGYTTMAQNGRLQRGRPCPECSSTTRPVRRRDGGHSLVCEKDGWFLADARWELVVAPRCPRCGSAMVHRESSETKGRFFWACFEHGAFIDADVFGVVRGSVRVRDSIASKPGAGGSG